jgi:hypothetical protein
MLRPYRWSPALLQNPPGDHVPEGLPTQKEGIAMWPFSTILKLRAEIEDRDRKIGILEKRAAWLEKVLAVDQRKIGELLRRIEIIENRKPK